MDRLSHPFPPLYDADSRILILGSFPSVKSREAMFFYGHPQNRFWRVVSTVLGCECPRTVEEKQQMLHTHHIALWDTIASCEISGSSDSSIREAVPTDGPVPPHRLLLPHPASRRAVSLSFLPIFYRNRE